MKQMSKSKAYWKPEKKCRNCGRKTYGLSWVSAGGWWHRSNRCWNCIERGGQLWDAEDFTTIDVKGTIIILEENHRYTKYFYKNNVR
jgi:hypothetical protein